MPAVVTRAWWRTPLSALRSLSEESRCHFVLAGFWGLYRSASFDYQSPIKNFAETLSVGALERDACRSLITEPLAALNLRLASDALVERIIDRTGQRPNLIAIICDEMLKALTLATRMLDDEDVDRAMESPSLRSALEGWSQLTGDEDTDRLDRTLCYALIRHDSFRLNDVLQQLKDHGLDVEPERIRESLTRLEMAFIIGREVGIYRWQVPLWRDFVLTDEPEKLLARQLGGAGTIDC